jgi:hypothetical protein
MSQELAALKAQTSKKKTSLFPPGIRVSCIVNGKQEAGDPAARPGYAAVPFFGKQVKLKQQELAEAKAHEAQSAVLRTAVAAQRTRSTRSAESTESSQPTYMGKV